MRKPSPNPEAAGHVHVLCSRRRDPTDTVQHELGLMDFRNNGKYMHCGSAMQTDLVPKENRGR
jgi:hypothetical protein